MPGQSFGSHRTAPPVSPKATKGRRGAKQATYLKGFKSSRPLVPYTPGPADGKTAAAGRDD